MLHHIAIFASGAGSNAAQIIRHFSCSRLGRVNLVVTNNPKAGVLRIAAQSDIHTHIVSRDSFYQSQELLNVLQTHHVNFLVLAGFLWQVPPYLVQAYRGRMLNIHPSLLPRFGGKGFYGHRVHEAVHASGEKESGITVHQVNENYDEGAIVYQARVTLDAADTPQTIEQKVRALELTYYPQAIEDYLRNLDLNHLSSPASA